MRKMLVALSQPQQLKFSLGRKRMPTGTSTTVKKVVTNCPHCKKQRDCFMTKTRTTLGVVAGYVCQACNKGWSVGVGGVGRNVPKRPGAF